jgi:two-component sensor histidine kinase
MTTLVAGRIEEDAADLRILLLEDSDLDFELITETLDGTGLRYAIDRVISPADFTAAIASCSHDLILADYVLPAFDGLSALAIAHQACPQIPFVFVSGTLGEDVAVEALKRGATDYVTKHRLDRLPRTVARAVAEARVRVERERAQAALTMLNETLERRVAELNEALQEKAAAERQQRLLVNELNHRVKNTLATIQSIASQTLRGEGADARARESFEARLFALSRAHDVLTRENWDGAELHAIVAEAIAPYASLHAERFSVKGPILRLAPNIALALSMAFHELCTNAAKYGALSNDTGRITIDWGLFEAADGRRLRIRWEESGGPPVRKPARIGFGSRLIKRSLAYELGGDVLIEYPATGVVCTIEAFLPGLVCFQAEAIKAAVSGP